MIRYGYHVNPSTHVSIMNNKPQTPCKRFKGKPLAYNEYWSPNLVNERSTMRSQSLAMANSTLTGTSLQDWKLVYLVLYKNITDNPDIMDVEFFSQLQRHLQKEAENNNVNPLDHEEWIKWLNDNDDKQ